MRRSLVGGALALMMVTACGALPTCSSTTSNKGPCTNAAVAHHAYVVVQHLSGAWIEGCVGFSETSIDGQTLMDRSGIEYKAQSVTSGKVVCHVDREPSQFTECFPQNRPYWALFFEANGHWSAAPGGFTDVHLKDREAMGWHYVQAGDPSPSPPPMPQEI